MPKPPFSLKLFEYLERGIGGDTSFDAISRRHIHAGMYLPSSVREVMGDVAVVVDTSGSMSSEMLSEALGYMRAFRDEHPHRLHFIQCDYDVPEGTGYRVYEQHDELPTQFDVQGRGGTSFDAPFQLLREKQVNPTVIIYMTDGYGSVSAESDLGIPTLWVVVKNGTREFKPCFGERCYATRD
jgi:predicted metal-dependent peptidase